MNWFTKFIKMPKFSNIVVILIPCCTSIFLCPHSTAWIREVLTDGDSLLPGSVALTLRSDASEVPNLWGIFFPLVIGMLLSCSLSEFLSDLDRVGVSLRLPLLRWCATSRRAPWGYKTFDGRKPPRCWKTSVANPRCKRS